MAWLFPDVSGAWRGEYRYDANRLPAVGFAVALTSSWFGRLQGVVRDDDDNDDEGIVVGRTWRRRISFLKTMPRLLLADGKKLVSLSQWDRAFADVPHVIAYAGVVDVVAGAAAGHWVIRARRVHSIDGRRQLSFPGARGTWEMQRRHVVGGEESVVVRA